MNWTVNQTYLPTVPLRPYSDVESAVILAVMLIISVGAIFGNTLVFIAYIKVKRLQRATNYFILSLAAADLFVGMLVINVYTMYMLLDYWPLSRAVCLVWLCADYWVFQSSVFGVLMIAVDRYLSIRFPHEYRHRRSDGAVKLSIIAMWLTSFSLWVPLILSYGLTSTSAVSSNKCHLASVRDVWVTVLASALSYVIPVLVIVVLAIHSFQLLLAMKKPKKTPFYTRELSATDGSSVLDKSITDCSSEQETAQEPPPRSPAPTSFKAKQTIPRRQNSDDRARRCKKLTLKVNKDSSHLIPITLDVKRVCKAYQHLDDFQRIATFNVIIAVAFIVTVCPYGVVSIVKAACGGCVTPAWWHFAYIMCYINSLLNPLCYALGNKNFNRAFRSIICSSSVRGRGDSHEPASRTPSLREKVEHDTKGYKQHIARI